MRTPAVFPWASAASLLLGLAGAWLIASHARSLAQAGSAAGAETAQLAALQPALPGMVFTVPAEPGVTLAQHGGGTLLVAAGMRAEAPLRLDLCSQLAAPGATRLLPLRVGYQFADVARWVVRNDAGSSPVALRNVVLAAPGAAMPRLEIGGSAAPGAPLQLRWNQPGAAARWIGDAGGGASAAAGQGRAAMHRQGWLVWGDSALQLARRPSSTCRQAGELTLQLYRATPGPAARALVAAFPAQGSALELSLTPGAYAVPSAPPARLEDGELFAQLQAHGVVRLGAGGLVELAPRDLAAWQAAPGALRARGLAGWDAVRLDATARALIQRLYQRADGDYVREQVRIFNGERRLLAWRVRSTAPQGSWRASVGGAPVALADTMPLAAVRLFAQVPQGWAPWQRIDDWPEAGTGSAGRLTLNLPQAAAGGASLQLLLVGRFKSVHGARLQAPPRAACSGRACPAADAAQLIDLALTPGVRTIEIEAEPLAMDGLAAPGDREYRHLRVTGSGALAWRPLASQPRAGRALAPAEVRLADRSGAPLWENGASAATATAAGLAPLLGLRAGHANSVAGMLARLPSPTGAAHSARLSLDLGLQGAASAALDCVGMRRGSWDGHACRGGSIPPEGRQAGIVVVDAGSGDILAAAGAGNPAVDAANWSEVRDFDRVDPARSPLRLPALQHDGGGHRAAGSTFKVISALGLELAAQRERRLDLLLGGQPLATINRVARDGGFAFRTDASTYPSATRLAHITNYRDQQPDRRAVDGRLGLAQALTYSLNTWFAWTAELSDRSLFGRAEGGVPGLHGLEAGALAGVRPIADMAQRLGFERALRLDGGLLPADYAWSRWDALQASAAHIDPIGTRHELRQMAIGLRMQATPLQMALVAAAVGQGRIVAPRLLLELDGRKAASAPGRELGVRLDRIRAGMKGVVDGGTAAGAFRGEQFAAVRRGLYGKTGTAPVGADDRATVWFMGWLEPGSLPGQTRRLAFAAFVSHSEASGGEHAAPVVAALLRSPQLKRAALP